MKIRITRDNEGNVRCQGSFFLDGIYVTRSTRSKGDVLNEAGQAVDATSALNDLMEARETARNWADERRSVK